MQTITFGALSNITLGAASFTIGAIASSGLPVTFASYTPSVCTVSGSTVTVVAVGTCSITASQAGNASYAAATPVTQSFTVSNPAAVPTAISKVSGDGQTSLENGAFSSPLVVQVNSGSAPLPGYTVVFSAAGPVSLSSSSVVTNAAG